ncbi:perosamine synthetase [Thermocatellispora tengchongensis]|uniref:Perosamine synthetase n=1 Tax=Thermocatellispora tengchongensis TaxID=1073253 RepID=A0A840PC06_9ACTN|nr:DegT/DnrJ/EryC1/StrS family aminotransferase [Thermocatellispora tengchongensis]MBB5135453.1 perosamine synthetase [Thermocatellispora tengchongensis]
MPVRSYEVGFPTRGSIVGADELAQISGLLRSDGVLSAGRWRERFERLFRDWAGSRHAMSVTSGTVALELAIHLADLRPGAEVIVTPQTFQASIQPLLGHPVDVTFCDVDPNTLNLDPALLEDLVSDRTAAVVLVHYGGCPAEMDRITAAAHRHGAIVIEDCAHALGATYHGRRPGALGDIGCFSFHNSKNLTTLGEGGMVTLARDDWAERLERLRSNQVDATFAPGAGEMPPPHPLLPWMKFSEEVYERTCTGVRRAGTNATLSEAASAVGVVQMARLPELSARRREIAGRLDDVIAGFEGVRPHKAPPGSQHAYHLYTFFVDAGPDAREYLVKALDQRGVEVQLRYFPLHLTPEWRWRGHRLGECPVAEDSWFGRLVNLPCHPGLSDRQVAHMTEALHESLGEALRLR